MIPDFSKLMRDPVILVMYVFVVFGAGVLGAILVGVIGRYSALLLWKDLSRSWILRLRLLGGLGGAVVAYALIGSGGGVGFGPGQGGMPGKGPGTSDSTHVVSLAEPTKNPAEPDPSKQVPRAPETVRVVMLGPDTTPPSVEPDRYFAIAGDTPPEALNVEQVVTRIRERKGTTPLQEVELVVSAGSSSFGRQHVLPLRKQIIEGLRLPFSEPDFSGNPLKDRSRFEPPAIK
jgi:hypothetical protein